MTIWDTLTGRKSTSTATAPTQEPHDNFTPAPFDPNTAIQNPSDFILDPTQLHPLAGIDQNTLDYLQLEDSVLSDLPGSQSALPSRGWSDDLCYGTGISYLSALAVGGAWGLAEGLQKNPATMPPRLRLNGVLNAVTRRGPFLGNSAGVVAMVYNGINSTIGHYRGKHDMTNSVLAGAASGAIFKSTRGVRPMMISSGIVASVAGSWALFRKVYFESD
ncbi:mitochondrial import inner membrane translocase subunit tim23 [Byssothecium circinans]|uniref:Mitochondrial import inner membrane translocase subunit tim23 n=1 Tax=Byssothecium circinans TaxID=147558 RepID=A0A6A5T7N6_9PLEO|nr:mitochondrial import inner membrane translocase subunit tim23 [Byssothecium circinans]KAF1948611.1 mitochondrial import inner membrane translocase subunit tim23 [Byssothecium circinans]